MGMLNKIIYHFFKGDLLKIYKRKKMGSKYLNGWNIQEKNYLIKLGKNCLGYKMNLDNPQTLNEKLNYYKLHYNNPLIHDVVDKIKSKEYVKSKGLEEIIIKTIITYDSLDEFKLEDMPKQFVVKNTLDSGGVYVCKDKSNANLESIKRKLTVLEKEISNGRHWACEKAYIGQNNVNKIIVEEVLNTNDGHAPADYKFFCFNGEPKFLYVGSEREADVKFDFYDINFNWIDVRQGHRNNVKNRPVKPKNYDKMIEICRILSKDFPHVRVDLYNIDGKIYFGELTFYHDAALVSFDPKSYDLEFGKYFDIESINKSKYYI